MLSALQLLFRLYFQLFAAVGLGGLVISYIAYRIIRVSVGLGKGGTLFRHSHGAWPWREVGYEASIYTAYCTAIALQSIHLFLSHCILFSPVHPLPVYTCYSRSISDRYGSFISAEEA